MPRTGRFSPPGLSIELDSLQATYLPGDTLTGYVILSRPLSTDQPWPPAIKLKLFGRAKSKCIRKGHNHTSIYRGRAVFFDITQTLSKESTPCNTAGQHAWPFTITIPTASQPGLANRGDGWQTHATGYLATQDQAYRPIDVTKHLLPPVLYHRGALGLSGSTIEAYVEYVLSAEAGQRRATLPLFLRQRGAETPMTNFKLHPRSETHAVRSPRLLPEYADRELTIRQTMSTIFKPAKTPKYTFKVRVESPTVIQLEHPDPIPLKIAVIPDLDPQRTRIRLDGDLQSLPPVKLTRIELRLKMQIHIRYPTTFGTGENFRSQDFGFHFGASQKPVILPVISPSDIKQNIPPQEHKYDIHFPQERPEPHHLLSQHSASLTPNSGPVTADRANENANYLVENTTADQLTPQPTLVPSLPPKDVTLNAEADPPIDSISQQTTITPIFADSTTSPPLNLGELYKVYLGYSADCAAGRKPVSFDRQVYPSITTYNIRIRYHLKWRVDLECAGEQRAVSGSTPVTIIPASEEQEGEKNRKLGREGMEKNYDDLSAALGAGGQMVSSIFQAVAAF